MKLASRLLGVALVASGPIWSGACSDDREQLDASVDLHAVREDLCSGCSDDPRATDGVRVHHVHLNVHDRARSQAFYQDHFGAQRLRLNGESEVLLAEPVLLLMNEREDPPSAALPTALQHIGFGAADPVAWYDEAHARGVEPDTRGHTLFNTNETPTRAGPGTALAATLGVAPPTCFPILDQIAYMYVLGPDDERIELWSGADDRVNHVHFTSPDVDAAVAWYGKFLDRELAGSGFFVDDLLFFFEADGEVDSYAPTEDHVLGHIAFSVPDLAAFRARVADLEIEVVSEPAEVHGFESFFVRGPDGLLIEVVEAGLLPGACPGGEPVGAAP